MRKATQQKIAITLLLALFVAMVGVWMPSPSQAARMRLKDMVHINGVRDNHLVGYGIVVGLNRTGDKSRSTQKTQQNLLLNFGNVIANENDIRNNNSAAVIVTTTIPPFAKPGDHLDVTVSSMADAKSLEGGVLVETQLIAANGEVVALAQGPVSTGGIDVEAAGSSKRTAITTSGRIPNGAIIEREMHTEIGDDSGLELVLNRSDYTMAAKIANLVSARVAPSFAADGGTIRVEIPPQYINNRIPLLAAIENLEVETESDVAKVVINERTGTIVIGNKVRLLPAAVAHGGITVSIQSVNEVAQPTAFSNAGATLGFTNAQISIEEKQGHLIQLNENSSLQDLVTALNALGVTPSDMISILQALKAAGSLEADLEII